MCDELEEKQAVPVKYEVVIYETSEFRNWHQQLRDRRARVRIADRLKRLASGNFGDAKSVGEGVWELRLHFGPGYRIYYAAKC